MKYIRVKSLTWWSSLVPLIAGFLVATESLHGLTSIVETINAVTGGVQPIILINAGLAGIGFRAALP